MTTALRDVYALREAIARQQVRASILREVGAVRVAETAQRRVDELRGQLDELLEDERA